MTDEAAETASSRRTFLKAGGMGAAAIAAAAGGMALTEEAAFAADSVIGTLKLKPFPVRVYDSRPGTANVGGLNTQGALTYTNPPQNAAHRQIHCGAENTSGINILPFDTKGLLINLAVVSLSGVGALAVYAAHGTQPLTANINWYGPGQVTSNAVTSLTGPRFGGEDPLWELDVAIVASAGASTHFIIDVVGYYS